VEPKVIDEIRDRRYNKKFGKQSGEDRNLLAPEMWTIDAGEGRKGEKSQCVLKREHERK